MNEIQVQVSDGYFWRHKGTPEQAAQFLAERSHHVLLHVEPIEVQGNDEQNEIRQLYFELGGEQEKTICLR